MDHFGFQEARLVEGLTGAAEIFHNFQISIADTPGVTLAHTPVAPYTFIVKGDENKFITFYDDLKNGGMGTLPTHYVKISFGPKRIWKAFIRWLFHQHGFLITPDWQNEHVKIGEEVITIRLDIEPEDEGRLSPDDMDLSQKISHSALNALLATRS
jgi:hypothetical protein